MLGCVSPAATNYLETLSSLRFASQARTLKTKAISALLKIVQKTCVVQDNFCELFGWQDVGDCNWRICHIFCSNFTSFCVHQKPESKCCLGMRMWTLTSGVRGEHCFFFICLIPLKLVSCLWTYLEVLFVISTHPQIGKAETRQPTAE